MKVGIVGASGLMGKELRSLLSERGHEWVGYSRSPVGREGEWRELEEGFEGLHAVVNMAGESIAKRWTEKNKIGFYESRVGVTNEVVRLLGELAGECRPRVLINASAVGYYGSRNEEILVEDAQSGDDYLAALCVDWEEAAKKAEELGVRVVLGRIGVVLGKDAEAWKRMKLAFQLGAGGRLGDGEQYWPWVHVRDVVGGILHALEMDSVSGGLNLTGPQPVKNAEFTKHLAKALHRPAIIPVPRFALSLLLGEFAEALLASYRAVPYKLEASGYRHEFATLPEVFADLLYREKDD